VRNHAAIIPISMAETELDKALPVLSSDDVRKPGASSGVVYASARFHDSNPKPYAERRHSVYLAAVENALEWINVHPHEVAELYLAREPQKRGVDWIERRIRDPAQIR
jgi:ABC-type nitrate/sulfonate/bicarbonate transport system substrate-binding protein